MLKQAQKNLRMLLERKKKGTSFQFRFSLLHLSKAENLFCKN